MTDIDGNLRETYEVVGELIIAAVLLDTQVNRACELALHLSPSPLLEPLIGSLDIRQKAEILKARAGAMPKGSEWRTKVRKYAETVEEVNGFRNIAAHNAVTRGKDGKYEFYPLGIAKIIKSIDPATRQPRNVTLNQLRDGIRKADEAYQMGHAVIGNLERWNEGYAASKGKKR